MSNQMMKKQFECLTCKKLILLEKIDPLPPGAKKKWNRYELDGVTAHICGGGGDEKQEEGGGEQHQEQQQQDLVPGPSRQQQFDQNELAVLQREVSDVKALIKTLISQVQMARQEIAEGRKQKK